MIIIGDPIPMVCSSTLQSDAGLCYPYCNDGFYGVGPICWQKCGDVNQADCAAACAKDTVTCVLAVVDQVIAPLIIAANIATLGMAAPITGAATVTIKTSSGATKVVSGATKVGNLLVQVVNMLQSINPANLPKGANVLTRIFESRTGTVLSKIITTAQLYSIEYKTLVQYKRAYAEDFASQTSAAINDEINRRYHSDTAQFFKQIWAELQLKELAEANAWEISSIVLAAVSVADISGVTGLVSAYAKPICKSVVPFPCIKADLTQTCK